MNEEQIAKLKELQKLLEGGILTPEEVEEQKKKILEKPLDSPKKNKTALLAGILGGVLLIALVALGVTLLQKKKQAPAPTVVTTAQPSAMNTRPADPRVYSCAYDGFVYMRQGPSYSDPRIGKFHNGPEGALLLDNLGAWVRINAGGLVGYVPSKYIQYTPTVAYYGSADVDWLEGVWNNGSSTLEIFNNGAYRQYLELGGEEGTWILQNNEIKFMMVHEDEGFGDGSVFTETLPILQSSGRLGDYRKLSFYSAREVANYRGAGSGAYTKAEFREAGKAVLNEVERYQR